MVPAAKGKHQAGAQPQEDRDLPVYNGFLENTYCKHYANKPGVKQSLKNAAYDFCVALDQPCSP